MKTSDALRVTPFPGELPLSLSSPALCNFREKLEDYCNGELKRSFPTLAARERIAITLEFGSKYIRVVRSTENLENPALPDHNRSVHCFVERADGTVWKAAGWKGPERRNPRGNVFNVNPLTGLTQYGTVYLR